MLHACTQSLTTSAVTTAVATEWVQPCSSRDKQQALVIPAALLQVYMAREGESSPRGYFPAQCHSLPSALWGSTTPFIKNLPRAVALRMLKIPTLAVIPFQCLWAAPHVLLHSCTKSSPQAHLDLVVMSGCSSAATQPVGVACVVAVLRFGSVQPTPLTKSDTPKQHPSQPQAHTAPRQDQSPLHHHHCGVQETLNPDSTPPNPGPPHIARHQQLPPSCKQCAQLPTQLSV